MRIEFTVSFDYNSWFEKSREPKTKAEWEDFLTQHFLPESGVIGIEEGEYQDIIDINPKTYKVEVKKIK